MSSNPTPIVFVVDDDVSVRESLELLIQSEGWQVETFTSAREFLARPRTLVPSCLVLDVTLPDLNGLELQQRVAADRPDLPIIFMSGYADVPLSVRAMKAGAIEFLTKPFADDVLLDAARHALERSRRAWSTRRWRFARYALLMPRGEGDGARRVRLLNKGEASSDQARRVKAHRGQVMRKMKRPLPGAGAR